jgi:hypothetical protein
LPWIGQSSNQNKTEIDVHEIIKRVGLEGLEHSLKFHDPEAQSCGKFLTK